MFRERRSKLFLANGEVVLFRRLATIHSGHRFNRCWSNTYFVANRIFLFMAICQLCFTFTYRHKRPYHRNVVLLRHICVNFSQVGAVPWRFPRSSRCHDALCVKQSGSLQHGIPDVPDEDFVGQLDVVHVKIEVLHAGIVHPVINDDEIYLQVHRQQDAKLVVEQV